MRAVRGMLLLTVALLIALPAMAQEKKRGEGKGRGPRGGGEGMMRMFDGLDLTAEQKEKIQEIRKQFEGKVADARKKQDEILTPEQKKAREEAGKKAREEGKSRMESFRAMMEAVKLTDEQKEKLEAARKAVGDLEKEQREKVMNVLTEEQKEKFQKRMEEFKKKMEGFKKKAKAE